MRRAITLLFLLANAGVQAAGVTATLDGQQVGARVDDIAFPATLPKELTSGLTNRLYIRASLMDAKAVVGQRTMEIAIRYDLWDQKYVVASTMEGTITDSRTLASLTEVNSLLASFPLPRLFDAATLPARVELTLRVEVLLNPLDREKMQMVRKWVAQNSTPALGGNQPVSVSNAIFNRIFEQYADGSNVAAAWRVVVASPPFRLDSLKNEGR